MLKATQQAVVKYPVSFGVWACLLLQRVKGINEIALFGKDGTIAALKILQENYLPGKLIIISDNISSGFPFLKEKKSEEPLTIYLCKNQVCLKPVNSESVLMSTILSLDNFNKIIQ